MQLITSSCRFVKALYECHSKRPVSPLEKKNFFLEKKNLKRDEFDPWIETRVMPLVWPIVIKNYDGESVVRDNLRKGTVTPQ